MENQKGRIDHEFFPCKEKYRHDRVSLFAFIGVVLVIVFLLAVLFKNFI